MNSDDDNTMKALDLKIARALQIDVPPLVMPELPDVDDKVAALPVRRRSKAPLWFAVAATVVLGLSIALRMSSFFVEYDSLADEVLAHLDHEPRSLVVTDVPVSDRRLQRAGVEGDLVRREQGVDLEAAQGIAHRHQGGSLVTIDQDAGLEVRVRG